MMPKLGCPLHEFSLKHGLSRLGENDGKSSRFGEIILV